MLFQFATILSSPIETFITPSSLSRFSHSLFAEITSLATESRRMALPTPAAAETERKIVASPRAMLPNWRRRIGSTLIIEFFPKQILHDPIRVEIGRENV